MAKPNSNTYVGQVLTDQLGTKSVLLENTAGATFDAYASLKILEPILREETNFAWLWNPKISGVISQGTQRLRYDVQQNLYKHYKDIEQMTQNQRDHIKKLYVDFQFIYAQDYYKALYEYNIDDITLEEAQGIPARFLGKAMIQRKNIMETETLKALTSGVEEFYDEGYIKFPNIGEPIDYTKWVYPDKEVGIMPRVFKVDFATGKEIDVMNMLGQLLTYFRKIGLPTSVAEKYHPYTAGLKDSGFIIVMTPSMKMKLATYSNKFASEIGNKIVSNTNGVDRLWGNIIVESNNLGMVNSVYTPGTEPTTSAKRGKGTWTEPKPIQLVVIANGYQPTAWLTKTGTDAIVDHPDYARNAAASHRITEILLEWGMSSIPHYKGLAFIGWADEEFPNLPLITGGQARASKQTISAEDTRPLSKEEKAKMAKITKEQTASNAKVKDLEEQVAIANAKVKTLEASVKDTETSVEETIADNTDVKPEVETKTEDKKPA